MKKSLKGIIAGLVAMFAFAPVVFAEGETEIKEVNVTIKAPVIGNKVEEYETTCTMELTPGEITEYDCTKYKNGPEAVLGDGVNYKTGGWDYWISSFPSESATYDQPFLGTFEENGVYVAEIGIVPKEGYVFADDVKLNLTGAESYELSDGNSGGQLMFYAKVKATAAADTTTTETTGEKETKEEATAATAAIEVLEGAAQKYDATGSDRLRFRFNLDFAAFKASGKIFVDGNEVDSKNYDSEEGSTIIIFTKAFTDSLKAGNHTMKLTSDEGEVETTFNVTKAVANPQTGDNIYAYVSLAVISLLGLAVSKKKLFN